MFCSKCSLCCFGKPKIRRSSASEVGRPAAGPASAAAADFGAVVPFVCSDMTSSYCQGS